MKNATASRLTVGSSRTTLNTSHQSQGAEDETKWGKKLTNDYRLPGWPIERHQCCQALSSVLRHPRLKPLLEFLLIVRRFSTTVVVMESSLTVEDGPTAPKARVALNREHEVRL